MNSAYNELLKKINEMPVIDTHEHLVHSEELLDGRDDLLQEFLLHYMSSDLISSGMNPVDLEKAKDKSKPLLERWRLIEPYWEFCRYTGHGRALDETVKRIYGFNEINADTIEDLGYKFKKANKPGHMKDVLKDICNIELAILDPWTGMYECDRNLFRRVWQPQNYLIALPYESDVLSWLEERYSMKIESLEGWLEAFEIELEENLSNGIIGLKSTLAYHRSLKFEEVDYSKAAKGFAEAYKLWDQWGHRHKYNIVLPLYVQDYIMHHILSVANKKKLFIQFHTGLLEGNRGILSNSNPEHLENLFSKYPDVKFDIFHTGYPYQNITAALAKMYPNVFIDMCWSHIISPFAARKALSDFLDAVPYNKIMGFGGDYAIVDAIYGHLKIARENIARVLSQKVEEDGGMSIDRAAEIAHRLLYDNPKEVLLEY